MQFKMTNPICKLNVWAATKVNEPIDLVNADFIQADFLRTNIAIARFFGDSRRTAFPEEIDQLDFEGLSALRKELQSLVDWPLAADKPLLIALDFAHETFNVSE